MGDFNKDVKSSNSDKDKLENFCNLKKKKFILKKKKKKKKKKKSKQKKHLLLTGLSNYHILISTFSNNRVSNNREVIRHLS